MKTATRSTTVSPRLISRSSRNASLFWQELAPHCSRCRGADGKRIRSCASSRRRRKTGRIGAGTAARGRARGNASASRESHNKRWTGRIVGWWHRAPQLCRAHLRVISATPAAKTRVSANKPNHGPWQVYCAPTAQPYHARGGSKGGSPSMVEPSANLTSGACSRIHACIERGAPPSRVSRYTTGGDEK